MNVLRLRAYAKVNYALDVLGVCRDGYHKIATVMQSISLADELELERSDVGFDLIMERGGVELGPVEENTIYRAWRLLSEWSGEELPVRVKLRKRIPAESGLGGGSADAAATLVGLNELFGLGVDFGGLSELAYGIGADVPFCLTGGTALGTGIGNILRPLPAPPAHALLVARPGRGASTAEVYQTYDEIGAPAGERAEAVAGALLAGDLKRMTLALGNDLEAAALRFVPEVGELRGQLLQAGATGAVMTGSGSAVLGMFASRKEARDALESVAAKFRAVCEPVGRGVEIADSGC